MPVRSPFPQQQQQQQQQLHHHPHHHRRQQRYHGRPLILSASSFLPSALLSAGCCAVIFLASAIAGSDIDPRRQMMETETRILAKGDHHQHLHQHQHQHQPLSDGPGSGAWGGGGPRLSTVSAKAREEQRRAKETHIIEQIKMVILNATGQENGPINGSLNRTGKEIQDALKGFVNSVKYGQSPKGGAGGGGGGGGEGLSPAAQGNPRRPTEVTNKIKEFADEVPNLIGVDGAVQFVLHPKQTPGYNGSERVINATMKVLVRLNLHGQTPGTTGPQQKQSRRRRRRRITIVAYLLDDAATGDDAGRQKLGAGAGADPYLPIAQLTVLVRKTNWHKVLLPTTIVQRVLDSADKVLRLRVLCLECNDETEVVMTPRRTRKKTTGRKGMRAGRLGAGRGGRGGGEGRGNGQVEQSSLLVDDGTSFATERKTSPAAGESRRSPVLIVSTRSSSSSRARKTG